MKINNMILFLLIVIVMVFSKPSISSAKFEEWKDGRVSLWKDWTITFSEQVNVNTVNDDTVYITESGKTEKHETVIRKNGNQIKISPIDRYKKGRSYTLHIDGVSSLKGRKLKEQINMEYYTMRPTEKDYENYFKCSEIGSIIGGRTCWELFLD